MINLKLVLRNFKRDIFIYSLMIISSSLFIALIISFQSTVLSGDLYALLIRDDLGANGLLFRLIIYSLAFSQYIILFIFLHHYYRFINKYRIRELAIYKITGIRRSETFKLIFLENFGLYLIILILGIILSLIISPIIINFTNNYLMLTTKLIVAINPVVIFTTAVFLATIIFLNVLTVYHLSNQTDLKKAIDNCENQKQVRNVNKLTIIVNFTCSLVILISMSYLSTIVTSSFYFGVLLIALFYTFGLYLLISSFANGYKYLIRQAALKKGANLLLINETNYHLNNSKLIILSSVIFMMLSIGALLLSNVMSSVSLKSIGSSNFVMKESNMILYDYNDEHTITYNDSTYDDYASSTFNKMINDQYQLDLNNTDNYLIINLAKLTNEQLSSPVLTNFEEQKTEELSYTTDNYTIPLQPIFIDDDNLNENHLLSFSTKVINETDTNHFNDLKNAQNSYTLLQDKVNDDSLQMNQISTTRLYYNESNISLVRLSQYNQLLETLGAHPYDLNGNETIKDGFITADTLSKYEFSIIDSTYNGLNAYVVSDQYYDEILENLSENDPTANYWTTNTNYYNVKDEKQLSQTNDKLCTHRQFIRCNELERADMLGNYVFLLLVAFYIAIIFIICNFTLIGINLLSHAINNQSMYKQLKILGLNQYQITAYINKFINTFLIIPLLIGLISGLIVTNFALNLIGFSHAATGIDNKPLMLKVLLLYLIMTIIFNQIIKLIYRKVII